MKIKHWKIEDIIPYENNPRINDQAVDKTAMSIGEFGWQQPIVVDCDGVIIVGHTRLKAAKQLKLKTCPVIVADKLSEAQVKAYRLADNKVGEIATWDYELLDIEIEDLVDIDFNVEFTGFELDDFIEKKEPISLKTNKQKQNECNDNYIICPKCGFEVEK